MKTITPLALSQEIIEDADTTTIRWYGWDLVSGLTWGESPNVPTGASPNYCCDVTIPRLMWGSAEDMRADIARELRTHARRLGL